MSEVSQNRGRVFISFSQRDEATYFSLFCELRRQGFDPYGYQILGKEIPPGTDLRAELESKIIASQWFICLISAHSLTSPWVAYEAQCALRHCGNGLRITPVVDQRLRNEPIRFTCDLYPDANRLLQSLVWHWGDLDNPDLLLKSLFRLYGIPFARADLADQETGLFFQRARSELPHLAYGDRDHALGQLGQAMETLEECQQAYERQDFLQAFELAELNDQQIVRHTRDRKGSYNVGLLRASLLMRYAPLTMPEKLAKARPILERLRDHTRHDEVVFQSLGYLALAEEKWHHARELYQQAYAIRPDEPDAIHGLALATLRSGENPSDKLLQDLQRIALDEEHPECAAVLMLSFARSGKRQYVRELLRTILAKGPDARFLSAVLVAAFEVLGDDEVYYAESWLQQVVASCRGTDDEERLLAALGMLAVQRCHLVAAEECFARLVELVPRDIHHAGRHLQLLCLNGETIRARQQAFGILQLGCAPTADYDHWYYSGMAKWVLGHRAEAEADFAQSHAERSQHYMFALLLDRSILRR